MGSSNFGTSLFELSDLFSTALDEDEDAVAAGPFLAAFAARLGLPSSPPDSAKGRFTMVTFFSEQRKAGGEEGESNQQRGRRGCTISLKIKNKK